MRERERERYHITRLLWRQHTATKSLLNRNTKCLRLYTQLIKKKASEEKVYQIKKEKHLFTHVHTLQL